MVTNKQKKGRQRFLDSLYQRFTDKVNGFFIGFERIVFKGLLRPIMYAAGMQLFLKTYILEIHDSKIIPSPFKKSHKIIFKISLISISLW